MAPRPGTCDGVLLLDKPAGYSSTQALARAKRFLGAAKAGHTGTLDPFATGLLPLVFGEATKFSRFLIDARKTYDAVLALGLETTSGDPEGEVVARREVAVDEKQVDAVLARFVGPQQQVPPMHSAVHVNGRRLYEYARAGEAVERAPREIEIDSIRRLSLHGTQLAICVACSKGTYIRSLAMDIGRALGCGASLTALRRTSVGPFRLEDAWTLEAVERDPERARAALQPPETLVAALPRLDTAGPEAQRFAHGQPIPGDGLAEGVDVAVFGPEGRFLGVGEGAAGGRVAPLRLMARNEPGCP
ncbi:MAG TPA: tRNA pseudouridine(55) synthase TruB [Usitatibacter sp.]|nr:tRNA pseudouridine(55) synthase TruB [Usitatibacter sp.]